MRLKELQMDIKFISFDVCSMYPSISSSWGRPLPRRAFRTLTMNSLFLPSTVIFRSSLHLTWKIILVKKCLDDFIVFECQSYWRSALVNHLYCFFLVLFHTFFKLLYITFLITFIYKCWNYDEFNAYFFYWWCLP